jgi:hypothetical protein
VTYTRPEKAAELRICRRMVATIMKDPCRYCINRGETYWERTFCKAEGRTYWGCRDGRSEPTFTLDRATIETEDEGTR